MWFANSAIRDDMAQISQKRREYVKQWRKKNRLKCALIAQRWRDKNRDKYNSSRRARYAIIIKDPSIKQKLAEANKNYRSNNLQRCNNNNRKWRLNNIVRCRENANAWVIRNKEKDSGSHKKSYFKHRDSRLAYRKAWYIKNKDRHSVNAKARRILNPEKVKERSRKEYQNNKVYFKNKTLNRYALKKAATTSLTGIKNFITEVKSKKFVICYYCNSETPSFGCNFDHIVPLSKGGSHSVGNLCVTCPTCNKSKGAKRVADWIKFGQLVFSI